jgi:hypothetical protein
MSRFNELRHGKLERARQIIRDHGVRELATHSHGYVRSRLGLPAESERSTRRRKGSFSSLPKRLVDDVGVRDVLDADWTSPRTWETPRRPGPYTLDWIIPVPGEGSGGHQNIFRFVRHLEAKGHTCRVRVYDPSKRRSEQGHRNVIESHFAPMRAAIDVYDPSSPSPDAIIATGWQTAYPALVHPSDVPRFYFVQDFEPFFQPVGSVSTLAEDTYRFGFHGITAGAWLKERLERDFGMPCTAYGFGVDIDRYRVLSDAPRNRVFFYARPPTPRRAWELGVLALTLFHERNPTVEIHTAGWPLAGFKAGFPLVDHGILTLDELPAFYNEMAAGLVLSMTNCSLLPLELLACGCVPVVNDAPNNRLVVDNPSIVWTQTSPAAIARSLESAVRSSNGGERSAIAASVAGESWDTAGDIVEEAITRVLRG